MKQLLTIIVSLTLLAISAATSAAQVKFASVDVFIDTPEPMAAWQFEFATAAGAFQIVGVENGDSTVFGEAPYYDREAVEQGRADRIIVADYSLEAEDALPTGRVRVTTLHLMWSTDESPAFDPRLVVATSREGTRIKARISIEVSDGVNNE